MREHKYRAWDKVEKEMTPWEDILGNLWLYVSGNYAEKYPLMQYTGLKDKNGKEIYEGDIVEQWQRKFPFDVEEYYSEKGAVEYKAFLGRYVFGSRALEEDNLERAEVIGNIYENTELLERG